MFDTGIASRVLKFPMFSLAYLLKNYCKVNANKEYQKADWRIRPLPKDMIKYAREDTHYLLYIYDLMRKDLMQNAESINMDPLDLIKSVFMKSKEICEKLYEKPSLKSETYYDMASKIKNLRGYRKCKLFKAVYKWRDHIGRLLDENPNYILPNYDLHDIIEAFPFNLEVLKSKYRSLNSLNEAFLKDLLYRLELAEEKSHQNTENKKSETNQQIILPVSKFVSINIEEKGVEKFKFIDFAPVYLKNCSSKIDKQPEVKCIELLLNFRK